MVLSPASVFFANDGNTGLELWTSDSELDSTSTSDWEGLLRAADDAAASEILVHSRSGTLLIGRLSQRRYWSETQARLLAQRIVWSHVDFLQGTAKG